MDTKKTNKKLTCTTHRSDRIHPKGEFRMRDLMTVLPMLDALLVLEVTGQWNLSSVYRTWDIM